MTLCYESFNTIDYYLFIFFIYNDNNPNPNPITKIIPILTDKDDTSIETICVFTT